MLLRMYELNNARKIIRLAMIGILILIVGLSHWMTPVAQQNFHILHVILRKLFVLPIVLAAIWFDVYGAVAAVLIISIIYVPHIFLQWSGQPAENVNQVGEVLTIWVIAILSGIFSRNEKNALIKVAQTHEGSLIALVAALDAREHNTELHSLRVREYALRLGREFGLNKQQMQILGQGSLLHDIGKIGTPDDILLKPGRFDDKEWDIMKQHPETGRKLLFSVPFLRNATEMVYYHHEKYDGSGYPRGLKGEQIPIESRIFAVVDVFDALNSDRPYRKKLDYEKIKIEIIKESGKHFDPKVVDAFIKIPKSEWIRISRYIAERAIDIIKENPSNSGIDS